MKSEFSRNGRSSGVLIAIVVVLLVCAGLGVWYLTKDLRLVPEIADEEQHPDPIRDHLNPLTGLAVGEFYVGVSALDVEANQRALKLFEGLSQILPNEPAVWANLAIARLRLGDAAASRQAVDEAVELASGNTHLTKLQATLAARAGDFDEAIALLQGLKDPDAAALYRLVSLVERTGQPDASQKQMELIGRILDKRPNNIVAQLQQARLAAKMKDTAALNQALQALAARSDQWSEPASKQFASATEAAKDGDFTKAARHLAFLANLTKPTAAYQEGLVALEAITRSPGKPFREFLAYERPAVRVAKPDTELAYEVRAEREHAKAAEMFWAFPLGEGGQVTTAAIAGEQLLLGTGAKLPFPGDDSGGTLGASALEPVDLNADARVDLAGIGSGGLALYLQSKDGTFSRFEPKASSEVNFQQPGTGVWALDFEADGDMDLLVARGDGTSQLVRNNGDMTFTPVKALGRIPAPRQLRWADLDRDGDVDIAVVTGDGELLVLWNQRSGEFAEPVAVGAAETDKQVQAGASGQVVAIDIGDVDLNGTMDLVALNQSGAISRWSYDTATEKWISESLVQWASPPNLTESFAKRRTSLWLADLDNNGARDLVAAAGLHTAIWLQGTEGGYRKLDGGPSLFVTSIADVNEDGLLDLAGLGEKGGVVALAQGTKDYHWQVLLPRAITHAGDDRFNSFGVGGRIGVRAGQLLQVAPITGPMVHFGLGTHEQAGVARIEWPNGTVQAEFELAVDEVLLAKQRLKGSCPFVFTRNEDGIHFVKDFIWRSPLGLKINSQETAGVSQTEDWIKIPGENLSVIPSGDKGRGFYEVRITAELWETHFFDQVSLMAVDHPPEFDVYIDERFVPTRSPKLEVLAVHPPQSFALVTNESGRDVTDVVQSRDGTTVDGFPLGKYQGLVPEHWVEFELEGDLPAEQPLLLVGNGWIYPTDSSLNVAISQGDSPRPHGVILEVPDGDGGWKSISGDLGFPAGKNKTVLIPLPEKAIAAGQRRFRLRTNLEIYWDYLGWTTATSGEKLQTTRLLTSVAQLRYRGFSRLSPIDRRRPDIPAYEHLGGRGQRWRDLEGYYTRFGDVRELLATVDDRYVIMNAGDEIVLRFAAIGAPRKGFERDFVLIGDGWVKDGDYNTAHSRTVRPLPFHGMTNYAARSESLLQDPVYQQHRQDWRIFHTRYITPRRFQRGLWPTQGHSIREDNQ